MNDAGTIFDETASGVVADMNGIVLHVTRSFCAAFGWQKKELIGQPITTFIPPAFHDAHQMGFSRFLSTGQPAILDTALDLEIVTGDGRTILAEHFIFRETLEGKPVLAARIDPR